MKYLVLRGVKKKSFLYPEKLFFGNKGEIISPINKNGGNPSPVDQPGK